ncbi:sugar dehydrogenase complex small subunit [Fluviispira multicolorata]|uniref:Membrane bound FAD containing D-sorbitol dehydrogenase n=1 Tax=Fluviispira multicolorata TaxID=2654512 RepID=A0A833JAX6_9BACT|nr:sugar dehydrogenase complex small subunit [Fluviispira multicolorata]KAB8028478.1 hypothetical protein GCL57_12190 [Fluviispira multicolorata]
MNCLKRREFLSNLVMTFSITSFGMDFLAHAENDEELLNKFMKISEKLTGSSELDLELGTKYLDYFIIDRNNRSKIFELYNYLQLKIPDTRKDLKKLSKEILLSWYTGVVKVNGSSRLVTYTGALSWTTLKGIKPQGICGGEFGYWAKKPKIN